MDDRVQITDEIDSITVYDNLTPSERHEKFIIQKIIWYLKSYYICNHRMPSNREIAKYMNLGKTTIRYWLDVMEAKDLITRDYAVMRSIKIVYWDGDKAVRSWKKISKVSRR